MQTVTRARRLRREMTLPEILVWQALRNHATGLKFRKQHPAGDYVLDFYCASNKLAIEIDGEGHASPDQVEHDCRRDLWLASRGVRVLRIPARHVLSDLANVIEHIVAHARPTSPSTVLRTVPLPEPSSGRN